MNVNIQSAEQIKIISVRLESPKRYFDGRDNQSFLLAGQDPAGKQVAPTVVQFTFYEDITKPYLTGELLLLDQHDLISIVNIKGTEKIVIEYQDPGAEYKIVQKSFVITSIVKREHTSDGEALTNLELIEDFGYFNFLTTINKGYSGKGEEIIDKIGISEIGKTFKKDYFRESHQTPFNYIAPHVNPYKAISQVLSNITTKNGMPFFYYSTIASDEAIFTDLESIMERGSFNSNAPFTYSIETLSDPSDDLVNKSLLVDGYEANSKSNTSVIAKLGGIGSDIQMVNSTTTTDVAVEKTFLDMKFVMDNMQEDVIGDNQKLVNIDFISRFLDTVQADKPLNDYASKVGIYFNDANTDQSGVREKVINGFNQNNIEDLKLVNIKNAILAHLIFESVLISAPGLLFGTNSLRTTVGNLIDFQFKNFTASNNQRIDRKRSGKFLILKKRHAIDLIDNLHTVSIKMSKMADLSPDRVS